MDAETKKEIKEIKISVPEGYEIDKENSSLECIKLKKKESISWRNKENKGDEPIKGYWIDQISMIMLVNCPHHKKNRNVFASKKLAESALAMAQISQILEHDKRFGGAITVDEWEDGRQIKYIIIRANNEFTCSTTYNLYQFLAFHTPEQRDLFLKENLDLINKYLMID